MIFLPDGTAHPSASRPCLANEFATFCMVLCSCRSHALKRFAVSKDCSMLSLDRRCIGQCLFVLLTACMLATPGAQASPATEDDPSVLMSELAQILECTATDAVKDRITNGISDLINHRLHELPDAAAYAQWKVTGLSMGNAFLVTLPGQFRAFGHSSNQLFVTSEGPFAVLDGKTLGAVTDALDLRRRDATHAAITADWRRLVWIASRPGEERRWSAEYRAAYSPALPDAVLVGCKYTRQERRVVDGSEWDMVDFRYSSPARLLELIPALLNCELGTTEGRWLFTQLVQAKDGTRAKLFQWPGGSDERGSRWWELPEAVKVSGRPVTRLYSDLDGFHVLHEGTSAAAIGRSQGLSDRVGNAGTFTKDLPAQPVDDHWVERRTMEVVDLGNGRVSQRCRVTESFPWTYYLLDGELGGQG